MLHPPRTVAAWAVSVGAAIDAGDEVTAERLCADFAGGLPRRVIPRSDGTPYLERFSMFQTARATVYLHRFATSDEGAQLHSHPWDVSTALVLVRGYVETRLFGPPRTLVPGDLNRITHYDFHRVDLIDRPAWTIFVTGALVNPVWEFYDPRTRSRRPFHSAAPAQRRPRWRR